VAFAAAALVSFQALAQNTATPVPDAGQVLREQAPVQAPVPAGRQTSPFAPPAAPKPGPSASTVKFMVKQVRVTGATLFAADELARVAGVAAGDMAQGQELTLAQLNEAAARITEHYQAKGYLLARAYLPQQAVRDGMVEIAVLEGRIGQLIVDNRSLVSDAQVKRMIGVDAGNLVNQKLMERRLLLLGETPGVGDAFATLQPGDQVGETRLGVAAEPGPRVSGQVDLDNHGNRYTGSWRVGGTLNVNSPMGWGDQLQLRALASNQDLYNLRAQYRAPVGGSGLVLGGAWSWTDYDLGKEFESLDADGWARTVSGFATYPLVRSVRFNLLGGATLEWRNLRDRIGLSQTVTDKTVKLFSAQLSGYGQAESLAYTFLGAYTHGRVNLLTPQFKADDAAGRDTQGGYNKLVAVGTGTWSFAPNWSLYGSLYGQWAGKNLDSSERLSLGGAQGVRAYPQGEASGDEGYLGSIELRYTWPLRPVQVFGFVDAGHVRFNADNSRLAASPNHRDLAGGGVGLIWTVRQDLAIRGMVATRFGSEEALAEPDRRTRLWVQLLWRF
jgi:hemolysin activation/secretion protein